MMKVIRTAICALILATLACSSSQIIPIPGRPDSSPGSPLVEINGTPLPATALAKPACAGLFCAGPSPHTYWVKNPASGARLFVQAIYPADWSGQTLDTLILVPDDIETIIPRQARRLADEGLLALIFDPDGRGMSEGDENLGGYIQQDGLAAVIRAAPSIPGVAAGRIGLASYGYGVTMASGALARYTDLDVRFLIDWEGPADREDTTRGCDPDQRIAWPNCSQEEAWAQREAITFIPKIKTTYQRLQVEPDHTLPKATHALRMINAAVQGGVSWVRLNSLPVNQTFNPKSPPALLPAKADSDREKLVATYAKQLFGKSIGEELP